MWSEAETLRQEKETLGFYVSSHPLESWRSWAQLFATHSVPGAREQAQDTRVTVPAIVQSVRTIVLKQGKSIGRKMAIVTIEDLSGTMDAVLFAESYGNYGHLVEGDEPIFVLGRVDLKRGDPQIVVDALAPISAVPRRGGSLRLVLSEPKLNGGAGRVLKELEEALIHQPIVKGDEQKMPVVPVQVWVETEDMRYEIEARLRRLIGSRRRSGRAQRSWSAGPRSRSNSGLAGSNGAAIELIKTEHASRELALVLFPADVEGVLDAQQVEIFARNEVDDLLDGPGQEIQAGIGGGDDRASERECSHGLDIDKA